MELLSVDRGSPSRPKRPFRAVVGHDPSSIAIQQVADTLWDMPRYPTHRATSAGGLVCDDRSDGQRWVLLIACRNAAGTPQWTLPKGGIEEGETDEQAAIREVREETGYGVVLDQLLGTIDYWFVWRPDQVRYHKFVHYYLMWWDGRACGDRDDEADHVEWVPLNVALVRLAHRNERKIAERARALQPTPKTSPRPADVSAER